MRIILFANGDLPDLDAARARLRPGDFILCADGGSRHALALGLTPDLIVGDLDSLSAADLAQLKALNTPIQQHPTAKNATDLELALEAAQHLGADEVVGLGILGGRLDHALANLMLLAAPQFADLNLSFGDGDTTAWIVRDRIAISGQPGDTLSALSLSPVVEGLTYSGLRWPLHDFTLAFGSSRGISNEMTEDSAEISLRAGILLVLHLPASAVHLLASAP